MIDHNAVAAALVASYSQGLVAIDSSGKIVLFNEAAGEIFHRNADDVIGKPLDSLFPPETFVHHQCYVDAYFKGEGRGFIGSSIETTLHRPTGQDLAVEVSLSAETIGEEKLVFATVRDISAKQLASQRNQQLLEHLTQAQKMEAVGRLAAGVAHDFNNMLGAIMGYAAAMAQELEGSNQHHRDATQILNVARRARRLTEKLLAFSRPSKVRMEVFSVNRVVKDVMGILVRTLPKNITIKTRLAKEANAMGDRAQIEQLILNLCLNARDALPDGGDLLLKTEPVTLPASDAEALGIVPGQYIALQVRDNGIGIGQDVLPRVFEPFFSTKPPGEGSGLGLTLIYSTVKKHNGGIQVSSSPGAGTTVTAYLPATDRKPKRSSEVPPVQEYRGRGECILLVDDEQHLREMAKRLFEGLGYKVVLAESGEEAEALYREQHDQIDLVILDVVLVGLSGAETLKRLQEIDSGVKVLLSSGHSPEGEPRELLREDVCGFVQKPYGIEEVGQAIRQALCWQQEQQEAN